MRLDPAACRARAAAARFAVLATTGADGSADLVPITFALLPALDPGTDHTGGDRSDRIVFAVDHKPKTTQRLARLANIARTPAVTLLFDHRDDADWVQLWWVRAHGTAVERPPGHERAALVARYPQYEAQPPRGPVVEITVQRWHGWTAS